MKRRKASNSTTPELPIFELNAFSKKATASHFYIQNLKHHVKEHSFVGKPHKHDFYLILFVEKGSGIHIIDFVQYGIQSNSLFLMTPGQVHTWTFSKDADGFVVFFTREFYDMQLSQNSLLEFPFYHSLVATPVVQPSKNEAFKFAVHQLYKEYASSDIPNLRILRAYLDILLLEAAKYFDSSIKAMTHGNTFKIRKLEQFIDENYRALRQPSDYADLMNLAPSYLNSICKDSLGKTLTQLIQGRLLLEAKRMFAYSDMNVNEVASNLAFTDPSYFVRWFRKLNGNTPEEFRMSI